MDNILREIDFVPKLYSLFSEKKWHNRPESNEIFCNYLDLLTNLQNEQRNLILELTKNYVFSIKNEKKILVFFKLFFALKAL